MIEPYKGVIYDPACGSGGMFVQSMKFIQKHQGDQKEVSIYGQEYTSTTYKLAKMNLAIRGIAANLGAVPADTFAKDQHKDLKADFIMAQSHPSTKIPGVGENELLDDPRWKGYEVPPDRQCQLWLDPEHGLQTFREWSCWVHPRKRSAFQVEAKNTRFEKSSSKMDLSRRLRFLP